jgi:hypothetical protein
MLVEHDNIKENKTGRNPELKGDVRTGSWMELLKGRGMYERTLL